MLLEEKMNKKLSYPRGSEWRKWDLHVHTPKSMRQEYGGDKLEIWEKFIKELEDLPSEFKCIGINDYLFIDGYKEVLKYKQNGRLKNLDCIFPVLEFRLARFGGHKHFSKINFHIIFSDQLTPQVIESQFLSALTNKFKLAPGANGMHWSGVLSHDSLRDLGQKIKSTVPAEKLGGYGSDFEEGFNNLTFDDELIFDALNNNHFFKKDGRPQFITAVGKTEWEDIAWQDGAIADKKDMINKVDLVFISSESVKKFDNAKKKLSENNVNNLLVDCSDAHYFSTSNEKDRLGKCFSWIKADANFEGLRQVLLEPEDRICIKESSPQQEFCKPCFSSIRIKEETRVFEGKTVSFAETTIPLNSELVAIVGGRGTGKSLLLTALGKTFKQEIGIKRNDLINLKENFIVTYQKDDGVTNDYVSEDENNLEYLHVYQGQVKLIANDVKLLDQEVKRMLGIRPTIEGDSKLGDIKNVLKKQYDLYDWFNETDSEGRFINASEYHTNLIRKNEQLINTITTSRNQSFIKKYRENNFEFNDIDFNVRRLSELKTKLEDFEKSINNEIIECSSNVDDYYSIPIIQFEKQILKIEEIFRKFHDRSIQIIEENKTIEKQLKLDGIEGDLSTLFEKVSQYQKEISISKEKLNEIEKNNKKLAELIEERNSFAQDLHDWIAAEVKQIADRWGILQTGKADWSTEQKELLMCLLKDIEISAEVLFDVDDFYLLISDFLNKQKFRATKNETAEQRIKNIIGVVDIESYFKFIKNEPVINTGEDKLICLEDFLKTDFFVKNGERSLLEALFLEKKRENYLKVISLIKYKGKEPSDLSVGQRGTFYICLKLATDPFVTPFVFDQPEDDLDNKFIMRELVPIFRKIKKYRQVIIATHNANLVVNADAEQVIVAHNEKEILHYVSGSLENTFRLDQGNQDEANPLNNQGIREHICDILEGGKEAFEKRERKYGFRN